MIPYAYLFAQGIAMTLAAWCVTFCASVCIGMLLGIFSCNRLGSSRVQLMIRVVTFIAKGIPAYVLILIAYFIVPSLIGVQVSGFAAACAALAFSSSGYVTEIIRAGINAVPSGQWDASAVLGYTQLNAVRRIIMPQAIKNIGPALCGEAEQLLKSTSLLATIGITEVTRTGMNIISRELNPISVYLSVACIYLLFSALLTLGSMLLEQRMSYGQR